MTPPDGSRQSRGYTVTGRVQGVGFRAFVRHHAQALGLAGWVRNEPDGTVAAEATGDPESLRTFEERLRIGPSASRVEHLDVRPVDRAASGDRFDVRF